MFLSPLDLHPADARAMHPLNELRLLPEGLFHWVPSHFRNPHCPEKKSLLASSPGSPPQGHLALDGPPGGAGSARPQGRHHANPNVAPFWPPPYRQSLGDGDVPWFAPGPHLWTRRAHPSEKTGFRVIWGLSPLGDLCLGWPRRGGAGSARPPCLRPAIWDPTEAHPSGKTPPSLILSLYPRKDPHGLLPVSEFPRIPGVRWNGLAPFGACRHGA